MTVSTQGHRSDQLSGLAVPASTRYYDKSTGDGGLLTKFSFFNGGEAGTGVLGARGGMKHAFYNTTRNDQPWF